MYPEATAKNAQWQSGHILSKKERRAQQINYHKLTAFDLSTTRRAKHRLGN
jgi:hypothetical protein